ncbi:hypothetical protein [Methylorubrum aminovorans]|uniref:hypothetical protein n=1 Tax=Methylorubrum aminovorans TaxID=269069 RepID=UPI0024E1404E|nr:hypothetical protein [Methylorubrum aminovorans]
MTAAGLAMTGSSLILGLMGLVGSLGRGFAIPARAVDATVAGTRRIDLSAVSERSFCRSAVAPILGITRRVGRRHPARHGLGQVVDPSRPGGSASGAGRIRRCGLSRTGVGGGLGDRGRYGSGALILEAGPGSSDAGAGLSLRAEVDAW